MTVFISYAREDEEYARELSLALIEANVKVWRDQYRLRAGDVLQESLLGAIRASKLFVVLVSEASAKSNWVAVETAYATEREAQRLIEVVPVRLEKGSVLPALVGRVFLDGALGGPAAIAAKLIPRALDAASPPAAGERVSDDARCYTHYGRDAGIDGEGRVWVKLDVVSFDLDSRYSILSQFHFISAERAENFSEDDARAIAATLIDGCAASTRETPWRVKLRRGDAATGSFEIECAPLRFNATYRIARIGKVDRDTVVFNAGALFDLISEPDPVEAS